MKLAEKLIVLALVALLGGISVWMQSGVLEPQRKAEDTGDPHEPDYYIENFTATGMDRHGRKYVLEATRLIHYPDDNTALLDAPHVVQYLEGDVTRHAYGESGWVTADGQEILLTGNVKVIQGRGAPGAGGVTTTDRLKIRLDRKESG